MSMSEKRNSDIQEMGDDFKRAAYALEKTIKYNRKTEAQNRLFLCLQ